MPTYWGPPDGSGSQLKMDITWTQSVSGNYSNVRVIMSYVGQWAASSNSDVGVAVGGAQAYRYQGYLSLPTGTSVLSDTTTRVNHNSNGTRSVTITGGLAMPFAGKSLSIAVNNLTLPTIPRQPSAPTRPSASSITHNSMTINFRHQGSIGATNFQLQRSRSSNFSSPTTVNTGTSGTVNVTGLTPGSTYYYRARAQNAAGWSSWSSVLTTYTRPQATTPTLDSVTATGMRVVFSRVGNYEGSTTWEFQRATNSSFTQNLVTSKSPGTYTISGLTPGTTYYFRARGKNNSGTGPWSGTASATTLGVSAPGLSVVSGNTGATATATIAAPSGVSVTNYTLEAEYLAPTPAPPNANKTVTTTSRTPTVTGLIPGASYRWRVRANIGTYSTAWSSWVTVTQVNPNTVDNEYFDSTTPTSDPDLTRWANVAGKSFEEAVTPWGWHVSSGHESHLTIRRGSDNLVPSSGSVRCARVKIIREPSAWAAVQLRREASNSLIPALPSATHTAKVFVKTTATVTASLEVLWVNSSGYITSQSQLATVTTVPGRVHELSLLAKSNESTAYALPRVRLSGAINTLIDLDGGFLALGRPESYFDGGTKDTARFKHSWAGTKWNSQSLRTVIEGVAPDNPFTDPNCPMPPAPPRPPVPVNECIPEVTTWRRYFSPLESEAVSSAFDSLPTFTVTTKGQADGPIRVQIFENPDNLSVDDFIPGAPISEQVITYLPANSEAVLDGVSERSYGKLASDETYADIDHLVFGSQGGPATWPVIGCGKSYMVVLDVPAASPLGNVELSAQLTNRVG